MEEQKSILVIGSIGHIKATKCIDWGEEAYVGDFDVLIINLPTLTPQRLHDILAKTPDYLKNLRRHIIDAQTSRGIEITCIVSPLINSDSTPRTDNYLDFNNYSWSPVIPILDVVPTSSVLEKKNAKMNQNYLAKIASYNLIFEHTKKLNNTGHSDMDKRSGMFTKFYITPVLENNIGKSVGFGILWRVCQNYESSIKVNSQKQILFIPPTENIKEGIDILIEEHLITRDELPDWIKEIDLPGATDISEQIRSEVTKVKVAQDKIEILQSSLADLNKYKKLLYATGTELEEIVEQSFSLLGVDLTRPTVTNEEDRFYGTKDNCKIIIEIRGVNRLMNETDLAQIIKRVAEKPTSTEFKTRGVFIFNHQNKTEPTKREAAFHPNIIRQSKPFGVCLLDTLTLFILITKKISDQTTEDFPALIFNTHGAFILDSNTPSPQAASPLPLPRDSRSQNAVE